MKIVLAVVALVCLVALPAVAATIPPLMDPTSLISVPTANTVGVLRWNAGATIMTQDDRDANAIYATVGIMPALQAQVARVKVEGRDSEMIVNGKLQVLTLPGTTVSVGMQDIGDEIDRTTYAVLSHTIGAGLVLNHGLLSQPQVHVGLGTGSLDGVFGGVSVMYANTTKLMAEYDGDQVNLGARFAIAPKLDATVATLDGFDGLGASLAFSSPW